MPVELYLALPHQSVAGWLMASMEFYDLHMKGLMLAPGDPAISPLSPTEIREMSVNTHSLPSRELLQGTGCVLVNFSVVGTVCILRKHLFNGQIEIFWKQ